MKAAGTHLSRLCHGDIDLWRCARWWGLSLVEARKLVCENVFSLALFRLLEQNSSINAPVVAGECCWWRSGARANKGIVLVDNALRHPAPPPSFSNPKIRNNFAQAQISELPFQHRIRGKHQLWRFIRHVSSLVANHFVLLHLVDHTHKHVRICIGRNLRNTE